MGLYHSPVYELLEVEEMAEMLGNNVLPESVVSARRRFRRKLADVREPVRNFRENTVPGPDIVGNVEDQVTSLRDQFVRRNSMLSMIQERAPDIGGNSGGSSSSQGNNGSKEAENNHV